MSEQSFNRLSFAEAERLALLAEECGEVIQAIGKVLRHGYASTHPDFVNNNRNHLAQEIGQVMHVVDKMCECGDVDPVVIAAARSTKAESKRPYIHYAENL